MYPHVIRLRGPWECEPLPAGQSRLRRRFGYPGRIDDYERVWLTLAGLAGRVTVTLNGTPLGVVEGDAEFEVTARLAGRNEVMLDMQAPLPRSGGEGRNWGLVALEVRRTAFLRGVQLWLDGEVVRAAGVVAGAAEGGLELYLVVDRRPQAYARIIAPGTEQPFHLEAPAPEAAAFLVKLELVQGASAWYTAEQELRRQSAQGEGAHEGQHGDPVA
jgi:hypothetical protein